MELICTGKEMKDGVGLIFRVKTNDLDKIIPIFIHKDDMKVDVEIAKYIDHALKIITKTL